MSTHICWKTSTNSVRAFAQKCFGTSDPKNMHSNRGRTSQLGRIGQSSNLPSQPSTLYFMGKWNSPPLIWVHVSGSTTELLASWRPSFRMRDSLELSRRQRRTNASTKNLGGYWLQRCHLQSIINSTIFSPHQFQNIVYNEYLPIVVGAKMMQDYRLNIGNGLSKYNPKIDPRVSNEFSTVSKTLRDLFTLSLRLLSVLVTRKSSTSLDHTSTEQKQSFLQEQKFQTITDFGSFQSITSELTHLTSSKGERLG